MRSLVAISLFLTVAARSDDAKYDLKMPEVYGGIPKSTLSPERAKILATVSTYQAF